MKNIEVEIRSFITKEQYEKLLKFFRKNATLVKEDYQETYYFDTKDDLRIQRNNFFSKIWLKKGNIHDECREEIEIKFSRDDFEKLEQLFLNLGFKIQIKWFRKRNQFEWNKTKVCLDQTRGYGYIIELEKICSEREKEKTLERLKQKLNELDIKLTSREAFEKKFIYYKENWQKLVKHQ
jgi:predicted adenylyl cyclase CyaB